MMYGAREHADFKSASISLPNPNTYITEGAPH
jgi:hypothetical protein